MSRLQPTDQHSPLRRARGLTIRRLTVSDFPYRIVFVDLPDRVLVIAVAHERRRPGYWLDRLP